MPSTQISPATTESDRHSDKGFPDYDTTEEKMTETEGKHNEGSEDEDGEEEENEGEEEIMSESKGKRRGGEDERGRGDGDEEDEDDNQDDRGVVRSPSGFRYDISRLPRRTQREVNSLFGEPRTAQDPPKLSLQLCGIKEDSTDGDHVFYTFQMHEVVPCSVRVGPRNSKRFSTPRCECPEARYRNARPCKHVIWLFDQISKQALYDHDPDAELTMTEFGYPEQLGDPYEQISHMRLDILADGLHCDSADLGCDVARPSRTRVREAREMVAAVAGVQPWELDTYRPDLEITYPHASLIRRGDLAGTLFSLLLASHSLASWMRAELLPSDPAVDPFRMIRQRVSRIIYELDIYSASLKDPVAAAGRRERGQDAEGPRDVPWAASQIEQCVRRIEKLVSRGATPLTGPLRASATRALVGILKAVATHNVDSHGGASVNDRNLYMRLVGNRDVGFVCSSLELLIDQSQFVEELEEIMDDLGRYGAPASYVASMRGLIRRMRSHTSGGTDSVAPSGIPRSATPPLELSPTTRRFEPGSFDASAGGSADAEFPTPELPASALDRGRRGGGRVRGRGTSRGTGSKRSVSSGTSQERAKSSKRPR